MFLLVVHEEHSSRSSPRAVGSVLTLPRIIAPWRLGQCRFLMPRVRRPVVSRFAWRTRGQQARAQSGPDSHPRGQYRTLLHRGPAPCMLQAAVDDHWSCSTPSSPSSARPASLLPPPAPSPSRLTHPTDRSDTTLSAAPATHLPLAGAPSTPHHLCVASERACVRNGGWGVWRAPQ